MASSPAFLGTLVVISSVALLTSAVALAEEPRDVIAVLAALPPLPAYLTEDRALVALLLAHVLSLALAMRLLYPRLLPKVSCGFVEVLRNFRPGKLHDWHHACALRAGFGHCWTIKLPHDPRIFATVDPAVVEHVLIRHFTVYDKGQQWRTAFHDLLGDGIFNADGE